MSWSRAILWLLFWPPYVALVVALAIMEALLDVIRLGALVRSIRLWMEHPPK
jgi:hypothetical protein